jgi:hypothetical protein
MLITDFDFGLYFVACVFFRRILAAALHMVASLYS